MTSPREWQLFYLEHPTPDPHALSTTLVGAARRASADRLPVRLGVVNVAVLVAGIVAAISL